MTFDWVKARAKCSLGQIFEQLRLEVQEDVEKCQALRGKDDFSGEGYSHAFHCSNTADRFTVSLARQSTQSRSVTFRLENDAIAVHHEQGHLLFRATVTINNEGRCVAKIAGQEMEF